MWREVLAESPLPRSLHRFLSFLSRFLGHGGRFSWTSIKVVIRQWAIENGRRAYTQRWILALLRKAVDAGLIRQVIHSAPGRAAVYEAVIPGHPGYRPLTIRRRGIRPRRLLASFRKEGGSMPRGTGVYVPRRDRVSHPEKFRQPLNDPGRPVMQARHGGLCAECGYEYGQGDRIARYEAGWGHLDCADVSLEESA